MRRHLMHVVHDVECVAVLITELGYPATSADIARRFERIDGHDEQILLVADAGGEAIGPDFDVAVHPYLENDASAEILGLVVTDAQRGRGVGAALVDAAEAWAVRQGCGFLRVRSRVIRERAHAFYERHGFQLDQD